MITTHTREDMITRFRDRLTAGAPTKLTQADLHRLIKSFVAQLQGLTTQAAIVKPICPAFLTD